MILIKLKRFRIKTNMVFTYRTGLCNAIQFFYWIIAFAVSLIVTRKLILSKMAVTWTHALKFEGTSVSVFSTEWHYPIAFICTFLCTFNSISSIILSTKIFLRFKCLYQNYFFPNLAVITQFVVLKIHVRLAKLTYLKFYS